MKETFMKKVQAFALSEQMLEKNDRIVAGISGGADSVCLLFWLLENREKYNLTINVVHVNHGIREEAAKDEEYVKALCEKYDIPFTVVHAKVSSLSKENKETEEEAGRNLRYRTFESVCKKTNSNKIAIAHNKNDSAETVLFNMFRGSGLNGLSGIKPVREKIIRPLLCVTRAEIEEYLEENKIPFCIDKTNNTDDYARNRIRHNILAVAEKSISSKATEHIVNASEEISEAYEFIKEFAKKARKEIEVEKYVYDCQKFEALSPIIKREIIYEILYEISPKKKDYGKVHIKSVEKLLASKENKMINLPYKVSVIREYDKIRFCVEDDLEQDLDGEIETKIIEVRDIAKTLEECKKEKENKYTKSFDYDKIRESVRLRKRETGDFILIKDKVGNLIKKSVKDYMTDQKIPKSIREKIPLLVDGNNVIWIVGYRISEEYKITDKTKHVLQVNYKAR